MTNPWWFTGSTDDTAPAGGRGGGPDLSSLAAGAMQLVELARSALLAPHAGHADPAEHPDCLLCRATLAFSERSPQAGPRPDREAIVWLELEREP